MTHRPSAPQAEQRNRSLADWHLAPAARFSHPREEHLLPLMIAAGAAGQDLGSKIFEGQVMDVTLSGFRFG